MRKMQIYLNLARYFKFGEKRFILKLLREFWVEYFIRLYRNQKKTTKHEKIVKISLFFRFISR